MDTSYAARYKDLYQHHWWWRSRETIILDIIETHCILPDSSDILDVGCGDGLFFPALKHCGTIEGIEPCAELVSNEQQAFGKIYVEAFDENFNPDKLYDLILILDVLEHVEGDRKFFERAMRLLKPGGSLLITVPAYRILWTRHDDLNHHLRRYSYKSLKAVFAGHDLQTVVFCHLFFLTSLAKLAVKFLEIFSTAKSVSDKIPPLPINNLLKNICIIEYRVGKYFGLPFGSSLVVLLRK